ncbi:unnamed protein product [Ostreobium quekettii]|uniref:Mannose-P-dolichol utilization defect 1 protein n=1 Tax=Ostreobium quekettii TaxID=121088 RepID=A0A8S1JAJ5_9CHLO|nr:unnamed protein product [Ostreobium quekettii]|eukprot:evm.model.scf_259.5 EVM.evm.TU.scf_259.5   scf_259:34914-36637(-)
MVVLWFQNNLLLAAMFKYNKSSMREIATISTVMAFGTWWLMTGGCPMRILWLLQGSTVFVSAVASRVPQIVLNIKNGGSGELSITTYLLNVLGCAARVLTTLALTGDMLLLAGMALQFVLNGVLLYQTLETAGVVTRQKTPRLQP